MAWDLATNWHTELLRLRLTKQTGLTSAQVLELFPPYPGDAPIALPDISGVWSNAPIELAGAPPTPGRENSNGSNNWVLSGNRSTTGKPLPANDPHLGLGVPSVWYLAHLESPDLRVIGATLPGIPGIILGRNDRIAWGFTNMNADVQDLLVEKLVSGDPNSYVIPEGPQPFMVRNEIIHVRESNIIEFEVRETIHGPVISDASSRTAAAVNENHVVSLAWTALHKHDTTARPILHMNRARNWDEFVEALRWFKEPQQNVVYADVDGNIGYHAVGRIPVRGPTNTVRGTMPVPGWEGNYDWSGYIPFEELPHAFNPNDGTLATANQRTIDDSYPHFIARDWATPYRIRRLETLLAQTEKHSLSDMQRMQDDIRRVWPARDCISRSLPKLCCED